MTLIENDCRYGFSKDTVLEYELKQKIKEQNNNINEIILTLKEKGVL